MKTITNFWGVELPFSDEKHGILLTYYIDKHFIKEAQSLNKYLRECSNASEDEKREYSDRINKILQYFKEEYKYYDYNNNPFWQKYEISPAYLSDFYEQLKNVEDDRIPNSISYKKLDQDIRYKLFRKYIRSLVRRVIQ